jgi:hypothetical protein
MEGRLRHSSAGYHQGSFVMHWLLPFFYIILEVWIWYKRNLESVFGESSPAGFFDFAIQLSSLETHFYLPTCNSPPSSSLPSPPSPLPPLSRSAWTSLALSVEVSTHSVSALLSFRATSLLNPYPHRMRCCVESRCYLLHCCCRPSWCW